jgi:hypothetical protein
VEARDSPEDQGDKDPDDEVDGQPANFTEVATPVETAQQKEIREAKDAQDVDAINSLYAGKRTRRKSKKSKSKKSKRRR